MLPLSVSHLLSFSLTATYANANAMQSQFGVNDDQAIASVHEAFRASAGLRDVALSVNYVHPINAKTMLMFGITGRTLAGRCQKQSAHTIRRSQWAR